MNDLIFTLEAKIGNLKVKYFESNDTPYDFLLTTILNKVVAVGWKMDDKFSDEKYFLFPNIVAFCEECKKTGLFSREELSQWHGSIFAINNTSIWHCPFNVIYPISRKENSLDGFLRNLNRDFPELQST